MFDKMEWYTKHAKKLDKKYYAKGESIYVLHRRTLQTAKSIIDLINDIPADDLFLELYMLVKDKEFGSFVETHLLPCKEKAVHPPFMLWLARAHT